MSYCGTLTSHIPPIHRFSSRQVDTEILSDCYNATANCRTSVYMRLIRFDSVSSGSIILPGAKMWVRVPVLAFSIRFPAVLILSSMLFLLHYIWHHITWRYSYQIYAESERRVVERARPPLERSQEHSTQLLISDPLAHHISENQP